MTRRASRLVRRDDERDRLALLRVVERVAYVVVGWALGYMMGLLAP